MGRDAHFPGDQVQALSTEKPKDHLHLPPGAPAPPPAARRPWSSGRPTDSLRSRDPSLLLFGGHL